MIRTARLSDAGSIARVLIAAWQSAYSGIIEPSYPSNLREDKYEAIFKDVISKQSEWIFVFEDAKTIRGFVSGNVLEGKYDSEIKGLYVTPDQQGKGIGTSLLKHAKEFLRSSGCANFILWTLLGARNNMFYEANGGVGSESRKLKIGSKEYQGIGYFFDLGEDDTKQQAAAAESFST